MDYQFTVSAIDPTGDVGAPKTFHIDNTQGDLKLNEIDGRGDLPSIVLVGGQETYADVPFILEAEIIVCYATQDYYVSMKTLSAYLKVTRNRNIYDYKISSIFKTSANHVQVLVKALKVFLSLR